MLVLVQVGRVNVGLTMGRLQAGQKLLPHTPVEAGDSLRRPEALLDEQFGDPCGGLAPR